jgi:peptidoglycan/xylan/chitin deacetylase (PgdA/CDA1 family)
MSVRMRRILSRSLWASGLGRLLCTVGTWHGIVAFAYHRIGAAPASPFDRGIWSATPDAFDRQLRFLKKHFDVIVPGELEQVRTKGRGRYVLITFDDGYRDNYEVAFPILKAHGLRATFFVATGFIDRPRIPWWDEIAWMVRSSPYSGLAANRWLCQPLVYDDPDRERTVQSLLRKYKSLPGESASRFLDDMADATGSERYAATYDQWMTWDMLRALRDAGMCIGGHTINHPVLARLSRDQQSQEVAGCRARLEKELGDRVVCFSYPVGRPHGYNDDTRACLREQDIPFGFSYNGGYRGFPDWTPLDLPRIPVELDVGINLFQSVATLPQLFA